MPSPSSQSLSLTPSTVALSLGVRRMSRRRVLVRKLPALALGMEPPERDLMRRQPRPPREPVITRARGLLILIHGS
ncbi:MAG: cation transporting ATPase C-terminal domain-containing protein [Planctomycetes bacterium]|nr:cation transporting ATPase C-terminal domain-containing protein [Planctomycetota bacterium]